MICRRHLLVLALFVLALVSHAIPARRDTLHVAQPDGTTLSVRLLGDEFGAWHATLDGYAVMPTSDGAWVYAELAGGAFRATPVLAHNAAQRTEAERTQLAKMKPYQRPASSAAKLAMRRDRAAWQPLLSKRRDRTAGLEGMPQASYDNFRGLVVLVEFSDRQFLREDYAELMDDMMNKPGYDGYYTQGEAPRKVECTGSVRDYFFDSSLGQFAPQFDVCGPIRLDCSKYATNGADDMQKILPRIISAMDAQAPDVDFSRYDNDGDRIVDLIYFVFAGAGSHVVGNDERLVWPHAWSFSPSIRRNGVRLLDYACSTELWGDEDSDRLDGIGTICHEFSHVLGLQDEYDTDYEENGEVLITPQDWSLMDGGSYLNHALTPPSYSLQQRITAGFSTATPITKPGTYSLSDLDATGQGYQLATPHKGEYYLLENKRNNKWNAYLPGTGMLVYQVDMSDMSLWEDNEVNVYADRPCYVLLRADESQGFVPTGAGNPFPGTENTMRLANYTSPSLLSFHGLRCELELENIREVDGVITFDVVEALKPTSVQLGAASLAMAVGDTAALTASVLPAELNDSGLTWTTTAPTVATVDSDGQIVALAPGTATIMVATFNGLQAQCTVTVSQADGVQGVQMPSSDDGVYDLTGRRVGGTNRVAKLPHGVYIIKGVKVVL